MNHHFDIIVLNQFSAFVLSRAGDRNLRRAGTGKTSGKTAAVSAVASGIVAVVEAVCGELGLAFGGGFVCRMVGFSTVCRVLLQPVHSC